MIKREWGAENNGKCVCVCVCVCPSPNLESKQIDRSRSKSISSVFSQISRAFFSFPLPLKLRVVYIKKNLKFRFSQKMAPTILIKFCGLVVHSKHNNMTLSAFPGKIPETGKIYFFFFSVS